VPILPRMERGARVGIAAAIATIVVAMGVASATAPLGDDGVRARVARHVAAIDARINARGSTREVAWGEATEGSAFDRYAAAARELQRVPLLAWNGHAFSRNNEVVEEAAARTQRERRAVGLTHLTAGARCAEVRWSSPVRDPNAAVVHAAMVETALRLRDSDDVGAVRLWLDAFAYALDTDHSFGTSTLIWQWSEAELHRVGVEAGSLLDEGCRRFDTRLSTSVPVDEVVAEMARPVLDGDYARDGWHWREVTASWRHGFSADDRHLAAFAEWFERGPWLAKSSTVGKQRVAQWAASVAGWPGGSFLLHIGLDNARARELGRRFLVTHLRMLRLALAWQHRQPLPDVVDPFTGEPFAMTRDGDTAMWISAEHQGSRRSATR
jgi:hypothetical protein